MEETPFDKYEAPIWRHMMAMQRNDKNYPKGQGPGQISRVARSKGDIGRPLVRGYDNQKYIDPVGFMGPKRVGRTMDDLRS